MAGIQHAGTDVAADAVGLPVRLRVAIALALRPNLLRCRLQRLQSILLLKRLLPVVLVRNDRHRHRLRLLLFHPSVEVANARRHLDCRVSGKQAHPIRNRVRQPDEDRVRRIMHLDRRKQARIVKALAFRVCLQRLVVDWSVKPEPKVQRHLLPPVDACRCREPIDARSLPPACWHGPTHLVRNLSRRHLVSVRDGHVVKVKRRPLPARSRRLEVRRLAIAIVDAPPYQAARGRGRLTADDAAPRVKPQAVQDSV